MTNDELIDEHVSLHQCEKAIKALHSYQTKKVAERQENELLPRKEENIWLMVSVKKVSPTFKIKPFRIPIAHPIVDPRTTPVCLITKDPQREYKDLLEAHKVKFISRVVGLAKLKGKFRPFEARRMLLKENGMFLADDRVIPLLPKLLGSKWFEAKKQPIPVSLTKKDIKKELERAISSTYMNQNRGTCTSVRIGALSQKPSHILDNLRTALPAVVQHIKEGWDNIQSLYIKTNSSLSLPIWTCDLGDEKGGRWDGLTAEVQEEASAAEEDSESGHPTTPKVEQPTSPKSKKRVSEERKEDESKPKKRAKKDEGLQTEPRMLDSLPGKDEPKKKAKEQEGMQTQQKTQSFLTDPTDDAKLKKKAKKGESDASQQKPTISLPKLPAGTEKAKKQATGAPQELFEGAGKLKVPVSKGNAPTTSRTEVKQKRIKDVGEKKKGKVLNSKSGKSIKATITGRKSGSNRLPLPYPLTYPTSRPKVMGVRKTTKIQIPFPNEEIILVGILEQLEPEEPSQGRGIALILHGTMGHKDYLYQRRLAEQLPLDSFRFDFRGNHESTGEWRYNNILEGAADVQTVVDHLKNTFGYIPQLVVSHSLGSLTSFYWLCHTSDGRKVPAFVNVSGRYRMWKLFESDPVKTWQKNLDEQGYHNPTVSVARKPVTFRIYPSDFEKFVNWDTSFVWNDFPLTTDVLTVHGLSDVTVPPGDALIYAKALGIRTPGTHSLHLMEGANHNFAGHQEELIASILGWWELRQKSGLSTGIWLPRFQQGPRL